MTKVVTCPLDGIDTMPAAAARHVAPTKFLGGST
jgi:hypothetical protein